MKTLPTLLASLALISSMVSCVGPMPMHPGTNVSLLNPFPSAPSQAARPSAPLNVNPRYLGAPAPSAAQFARPVSFNPRMTDFVTQAFARPTVPLTVNPRLVNLGGGGSDYQPHLASEYRNGWRAGAQDAAYGAPRDYRRAYVCQGSGWESYFQEGYNDGYEGRGMAH